MTAYAYLLHLKTHGLLPLSRESGPPWARQPSNSEVKRWLRKRSVGINGERPDLLDEIETPVRTLVYFPKGKYPVTVL